MRQSSNSGRRLRGRPNRNKPHGGTPNRNSTFESNGPEGKVRGNAAQVFEKYVALAREAAAGGNRVGAEAFYQHAEHYYRIINDSTDPRRKGRRPKATPGATSRTEMVSASNAAMAPRRRSAPALMGGGDGGAGDQQPNANGPNANTPRREYRRTVASLKAWPAMLPQGSPKSRASRPRGASKEAAIPAATTANRARTAARPSASRQRTASARAAAPEDGA